MLVIKYVFLLSILIICAVIGILISKKYSTRVEILNEFKNSLNILKTKIKFTYDTLPEIFEYISSVTNSQVSKTYINACQNMKRLSIDLSWQEAIDKNLTTITKEDRDVLKDLSKLLGKTDVEGQLSQIELTCNFLDSQINKACIEQDKNSKLYKKLGLVVGIGIFIILI